MTKFLWEIMHLTTKYNFSKLHTIIESCHLLPLISKVMVELKGQNEGHDSRTIQDIYPRFSVKFFGQIQNFQTK